MRSTFFLCALVLLLGSCATIFSKSIYDLHVRTEPKGAGIVVLDKFGKEIYHGMSPAVVPLRGGAGYFSKASYTVKLSAPGFAVKEIPVEFKLNGWYFGNLLIGGLIGMLIVDPATGAMWKIRDPLVDETLDPARSSAATPSLQVLDVNNISPAQRARLVPIN